MQRERLIYGWASGALTVLADSKKGTPKVIGCYSGEDPFREFVIFLSNSQFFEEPRGAFSFFGCNPVALRGHLFAASVKLGMPFPLDFLTADDDVDPVEIAGRTGIAAADMPAFYGLSVDPQEEVPAVKTETVEPTSEVKEEPAPPGYVPNENADIDARLMFELAKAWGLIRI